MALIVILAIAAAIWWWRKKHPALPVKSMDMVLSEAGMEPAMITTTCGGQWGIAIDTMNNRIAIGQGQSRRVLNMSQIVRVEPLIDGQPADKATGSGPVMGGAILGELIAGPVGAMVGAGMAMNRIKLLSIRMLTDDLAQPWIEVPFWQSKVALPLKDKRLREPLGQWRDWSGRLQVVVARQPTVVTPVREERGFVP